MVDRKIHCDCGASWDIDDNLDDIFDTENSEDSFIENACYTCPVCGSEIDVSLCYTKKLVEIKY